MNQHKHNANQNRQQDIERRFGQKQEHEREHRQYSQNQSIVNQTAEDDQRLVAKEIQEQPNGKHGGEDDEGDRMPQEAQEQD